jgi:hypothetical protein
VCAWQAALSMATAAVTSTAVWLEAQQLIEYAAVMLGVPDDVAAFHLLRAAFGRCVLATLRSPVQPDEGDVAAHRVLLPGTTHIRKRSRYSVTTFTHPKVDRPMPSVSGTRRRER